MRLQADFPNEPKFTIHIFSVFSLPHHLCPWIPQIVVPSLPGKALKRQLPFRSDEGLFEDSFIEERRAGLEQFINKSVCSPGLRDGCLCSTSLVQVCRTVAQQSVTNRWSALCCVCPLCVSPQDRGSPPGPERALSSHVPARGNHRPQLRSWKSTTLGLLRGWGLSSGVIGWTVWPFSHTSTL